MEFMDDLINKIHLGDCYEMIKQIPDKSINCIYTDIPYLYDSGGGGSSELALRIHRVKKKLHRNRNKH